VQIRDAQLRIGDREIFVNEKGERMSRLKDVNDEWILRRLERWGKKVGHFRLLPSPCEKTRLLFLEEINFKKRIN
jgi:hypothetical protein